MSAPDPPLALGDTIYIVVRDIPRMAVRLRVLEGQVIGVDSGGVPYADIRTTGAMFNPRGEDEGRTWARGEEDSPDVEALKTVIMLGGDGT